MIREFRPYVDRQELARFTHEKSHFECVIIETLFPAGIIYDRLCSPRSHRTEVPERGRNCVSLQSAV
jgi:uncharacterized protein (DUF2235 family)